MGRRGTRLPERAHCGNPPRRFQDSPALRHSSSKFHRQGCSHFVPPWHLFSSRLNFTRLNRRNVWPRCSGKVGRLPHQERNLLRRCSSAHIVTKSVARPAFHVNQHQAVKMLTPPGSCLADVRSAIHFHPKLSHGLGASLAHDRRAVHQKDAFIFQLTAQRYGMRQPHRRRVHATTGFGSAPVTNFFAGLLCDVAFVSSWRFRMRRASFCLRIRLNRDLSPLTPDIIDSCHSSRLIVGCAETSSRATASERDQDKPGYCQEFVRVHPLA